MVTRIGTVVFLCGALAASSARAQDDPRLDALLAV